jgi:hypothetical protein
MNLTRAHAEYWRQRKTPAPQWAAKLDPVHRVTIDGLVNAHAGIKDQDYHLAAGNLMVILRSARKRGRDELITSLTRMSSSPGTIMNPKRRAGYCRKWLRRIQRSIDDRPL